MKFLRLLYADMCKSVLFRILLCSLGTVIILSGIVFPWMSMTTVSVAYLLDLSLRGSGSVSIVLCVLPVLAFSTQLADEWNSKVSRDWLMRAGVSRYVIAKIIVSAISGFFVIFLGLLLFIGIHSINMPLFQYNHTDHAYARLMEEGKLFLGFACYVSNYSLSGLLTAVCGTFVSAFIPNRFVSVSAPLVLYFSLMRITERLLLPQFLIPEF